ncbi:hypothetical protein L596_028552 [Steinernema carpocapsae]|uniref:Cystatin domain-containing protein n=1 Tax=Steinernema carpocapsae TaxID=34508 RepID=A0A4U5LYS4_STECR|nr:hypothetical protein L596_028552 [Steinernema carpocapsae]
MRFFVLSLVLGVAFAAPGGEIQLDLHAKELEPLKWVAMKTINENFIQSPSNFLPGEIRSASKQITGDIIYKFTMEVREADCLRSNVSQDNLQANACKQKADGAFGRFDVEIHQSHDKKKTEVTQVGSAIPL